MTKAMRFVLQQESPARLRKMAEVLRDNACHLMGVGNAKMRANWRYFVDGATLIEGLADIMEGDDADTRASGASCA